MSRVKLVSVFLTALVVVGLFSQVQVLRARIKTKTAQNAELRANLQRAENNAAGLMERIREQNEAVTRYRAVAQAQEAKAAEAAKRALEAEKASKAKIEWSTREIEKLKARYARMTEADACRSAWLMVMHGDREAQRE